MLPQGTITTSRSRCRRRWRLSTLQAATTWAPRYRAEAAHETTFLLHSATPAEPQFLCTMQFCTHSAASRPLVLSDVLGVRKLMPILTFPVSGPRGNGAPHRRLSAQRQCHGLRMPAAGCTSRLDRCLLHSSQCSGLPAALLHAQAGSVACHTVRQWYTRGAIA
jgi:hypothetical protein